MTVLLILAVYSVPHCSDLLSFHTCFPSSDQPPAVFNSGSPSHTLPVCCCTCCQPVARPHSPALQAMLNQPSTAHLSLSSCPELPSLLDNSCFCLHCGFSVLLFKHMQLLQPQALRRGEKKNNISLEDECEETHCLISVFLL